MGNDNRKGNRSSVPTRGGFRRSNTPPPPSVRLGIDGLPETEPISTSRPRVDELPKAAAVIEPPPAEVVAAPPKPVVPEVVEAPPDAEAAPVVEPEPPPPPQPAAPSEPPPADEGRASLLPRRSLPPPNRKRGSNLKGAPGKSLLPPPVETAAPAPTVPVAIGAALATADAEEASTAKAPPVARPEPASETADDDSKPKSSPPARDLDEGFFEHGERAVDAHAEDLDHYDEKMALKNSPEARAQRAKNWRWVIGVGAVALLVLLIADVKNRSSHGDPISDTPPSVAVMPPPPAVTSGAAATPDPTPVAVVVPPATAADDLPVASAAPAAASGAPSGAPAASGAPVASAAPADSKGWVAEPAAPGSAAAAAPGAPPAAGAEPTADDKKSAALEKRACQTSLDQGAFAKAIAAGEHSVALDPTDGEAWLLLGAAYQSIGKGAEAHRTFASCVAEGKRGPVNECRAMLH